MRISITSTEYSLLKNSSIGERIRLLRRKLMEEVDPVYYTTSSISERTGIAAQTITSIERGESKKPSFSVIHALAKELHVSMEVFTDEYYEEEEMLFSLGKPDEAIEVDFDLEELDSLTYVSDNDNISDDWHNHRKISFIVHEETLNGEEKQLYFYTKYLKEIELIDLLSKLIQSIELTPHNLSSSEWKAALERSPLKEANEIVSKDYSNLPNLTINKEV